MKNLDFQVDIVEIIKMNKSRRRIHMNTPEIAFELLGL